MSDWKFEVDEVDEDGVVDDSIEPGSPALENAVFVVLGAVAGAFVVVRLAMLMTG